MMDDDWPRLANADDGQITESELLLVLNWDGDGQTGHAHNKC